jgi:hypothetical protein
MAVVFRTDSRSGTAWTPDRASFAEADAPWWNPEAEQPSSGDRQMGDLLSQAVSMTQPWWYEKGVRIDLQPGCTEPLATSSRHLVWCMVNLFLGYSKALESGEVLRVSTWQEDDHVRLHFACEATCDSGPDRQRQVEGMGSFWARAQHFARLVSADLQMTASRLSADLRVPVRG